MHLAPILALVINRMILIVLSIACSVALYSDQVQGAICVFSDLQSGVTHLVFSPCGNFLFSGERKVFFLAKINITL